MKFYRAQPEKRRYAALLVPGSSSLTGADSWKAEQFRKECQEAGWDFQCNGTYWQIFYTTDESVKLTGDMMEERQFLIQKALSWNGSAKISYPVLVVLNFLSCTGSIKFVVVIQQSAESGKNVCGFRGAYAKSPAAWNLHFLDGNLCAAVSMEPWEYNGYKRRQAVSENESAAEGKL